ncbi:hypothetical protein B0H15DRAFT_852731 [Mycena belliarum]|uniref:Uncharacterized protein n=1 Tax=Mycena belliarum TaxID=1033014 RepID=A0AAD6TYZ2_9AGAR|nr:hypothetical protein B0H15DRAFT_852731 [Mycena belliae]
MENNERDIRDLIRRANTSPEKSGPLRRKTLNKLIDLTHTSHTVMIRMAATTAMRSTSQRNVSRRRQPERSRNSILNVSAFSRRTRRPGPRLILSPSRRYPCCGKFGLLEWRLQP